MSTLCVVALMASPLYGCHRAADVDATTAAIQVVDDMGSTVSLPRAAARIASLSPALTEILYAVGCGPSLVLRDRWSDVPDAAKSVADVDSLSPSVELILASRPSLVLTSFPPARLRGALDDAGIAWLGLAPQRLDAIGHDIERIARLCGNEAQGDTLRAGFDAELAAIDRALQGRPAPRVYLELDHAAGKGWTIGDDTFVGDLLRRAHSVNVFGAERGWPQISSESILAADPDVVLLAWPAAPADQGALDPQTAAAAFAARPGLASMRAVQAGRVYRVDAAALGRPGPRVVHALRAIAALLHPDAARKPQAQPATGAEQR